jgi:hypothetical protein
MFFNSLVAFAQYSIQGHVLEGEKNTPLKGANVFIANTTYGAVTDVNGAFEIHRLPIGHYKLVVSFVGYETQVIDIVNDKPVNYKIILKPAINTLEEVVIRSRRKSHAEWIANFNIFKQRFIGLSENARFCQFENPTVLDFSNRDGLLKATADSTLILRNNGLGYRIKIQLEKYIFNELTIRIHYEGQIVYEPLDPIDSTEKVTWAKNRLKAYYGSEMHFLRSLYERNLNQDGYYVNLVNKGNSLLEGLLRRGYADTAMTPRSPIYNNRRIKMHTITNYNRILDSVNLALRPDLPLLNFKGELEVQYIMESEPYSYQSNRQMRSEKIPQRSSIILRRPAIVQPFGHLFPPDAIETKGYWSWELIAESLPLDYEPGPDIETLGEN